jgi:hypothetical protein
VCSDYAFMSRARKPSTYLAPKYTKVDDDEDGDNLRSRPTDAMEMRPYIVYHLPAADLVVWEI